MVFQLDEQDQIVSLFVRQQHQVMKMNMNLKNQEKEDSLLCLEGTGK